MPNPSLKRDCQRRATRPAQPLVQSSASRAWRHTVGSRLAPTLGLTTSIIGRTAPSSQRRAVSMRLQTKEWWLAFGVIAIGALLYVA